jgi:hypothetical protein
MQTKQQIDQDLVDVAKRLARARAHEDVDQILFLLVERDHLLDRLLDLRKVSNG